MDGLSETQKRRRNISNLDDDFDVTSLKHKKSRSSGTDTIAQGWKNQAFWYTKVRAAQSKFKRTLSAL